MNIVAMENLVTIKNRRASSLAVKGGWVRLVYVFVDGGTNNWWYHIKANYSKVLVGYLQTGVFVHEVVR